MFGMRGYSHSCGPYWAAGRHGHRGFGPGFGWGGRGRGPGGGDMFRIGRLFAQGDLKLLALALIAEQPRHGYEIIKLIEEKTNGWYSPSPGVVYPTLTYLEEVGYLISESEGSKKRYRITPEGESYLKSNRDIVDVVLDRLAAIGRKMARMRRAFGGEGEGERSSLPQVVGAALSNLSESAGKRLEGDADTEAKIVEILMRAANDIKNA
jgi:DNA-binding PadR family transcriptional regulator